MSFILLTMFRNLLLTRWWFPHLFSQKEFPFANCNELSHRQFQLLDSLRVHFEIATLLVLHEEPSAFFLHVFHNEPAAHLISEPGVATPRELVTDDASSQPEGEKLLIFAEQKCSGEHFFCSPEHFFSPGSKILLRSTFLVPDNPGP